jgi:hypothetical protein
MLAPFTSHLLAAAAIGRADRVVDLGCGTGSTTRAAGRVAIEGAALGWTCPRRCRRLAAHHAQRRRRRHRRVPHLDRDRSSLLRDADPPTVARASEAVQAALQPYVTPDGLLLGSRHGWSPPTSRRTDLS